MNKIIFSYNDAPRRLWGIITLTCIIMLTSIIFTGCGAFSISSKSAIADKDLATDSSEHDRAEDYFLTATVHQETGELHKAAVYYQLALMSDPKSTEIALALSSVYVDLGAYDAAIKILEQSLGYTPSSTDVLSRVASYYLRRGRFVESQNAYEKLARIRPLEEMELLRLALVYRRGVKLDKAIELFNEYQSRFGPRPEIYEEIGKAYLMEQDIDGATSAFENLVELAPENHRVLFVLGGFAVSKSEWDRAESYFRRSINYDSSNVEYWSNLLLALEAQDKFGEIVEVINTAESIFSDFPLLYVLRGNAYSQLKRFDEALTDLKLAIELDSSNALPYVTMGYIYHELKEWALSEAAYKSVLEINPDNALVLNNYAFLLAEQNYRLEDALEMVQKALEQYPDNPSYRDTYGWILYRLGRYDQALVEIQFAINKEPENAELWDHLGFVYAALGNDKKAHDAWKRSKELEPDNQKYQKLSR